MCAPSPAIGGRPSSSGAAMADYRTGPRYTLSRWPTTRIDAIEAPGLLDGLEGQARAERAELIEWLLGEGFTSSTSASEFAPMLMPAGRVVGDDGVYVSSRQICEDTGIDLELLEAMQRALGLPRVDDPDAPFTCGPMPRPPGSQMFIDVGFSREQLCDRPPARTRDGAGRRGDAARGLAR